MTGNRWITVDASHSQNPFGSDTSAMAIQHPNNLGWEIIGQTVGAPAIRIRNKKLKSDGSVEASKWIKVYSETDKPQADDNDFVSKKSGGTFTGNLQINSSAPTLAMGSEKLCGLRVGGTNNDTMVVGGKSVLIFRTGGKGIDSNASGMNEVKIDNAGNITAQNQRITANVFTSVAQPTSVSDLTRKDYVDNGLNKKINVGVEIDFGTY